MKEDTETLFEILLSADRICSKLEEASLDMAPSEDYVQLRTKLLECRAALRRLQGEYEQNKLTIVSSSIAEQFRHLMLYLLWVIFYSRAVIDRRTFRRFVVIHSAFTHLLLSDTLQD